MLFGITNVFHEPKINARSWQSFCVPILRQGVLESVSCRIICLRDRPDDSRQRRELDEEIEIMGEEFV